MTVVNNANKMYPPLFLTPVELEFHGRKYARKQGSYFVNKVFTEWDMDVLRSDLIERARKMTRVRSNQHPWLSMNDEELLRSAGLILLDHESRKEGITLAAILLFGKDTTIMSALPQHKTDMIFRVQNVDRYDDRDVIVTNLLDSYDRMNEFAKKHLNDPFALDGMQSVSARDTILREMNHILKIQRSLRCLERLDRLMSWAPACGIPINLQNCIREECLSL